jgi:ubiquinone/menaquinone biosynthesis C-methylase UbiE
MRHEEPLALHPLAQRFASVAEVYERGRPDYPPGAVGALAAELSLSPGAPVLDLGAGTGKLSRALLAYGLDVVAVEPLPELRGLLAGQLGADRVHEGTAEAIPLADGSVDAVTVADAFHWFDRDRALTEIRRVLRPAGGLAVVAVVPDWSGASWADELGKLVVSSRPEHPNFDGPPWQDAVRNAGGWLEPREIRVTASQRAEPERIVDHLNSVSWIAAMPEEEREASITRIRALVTGGETPADMPVHFVIGLTSLAPAAL